ncbi:hypothetical protein QEN19_001278 [Hanseniaspora menglaensis]
MRSKQTVGKNTVIECKATAYKKALNNFLKSQYPQSKNNFKTENLIYEDFQTKEQILVFNDDDFKLKIANESLVHHKFIETVCAKQWPHYINKCLILYDNENNLNEREIIEKLILATNFNNSDVYINNIENTENLLPKSKSIETFKDNYRIYTKNEINFKNYDFISPVFNTTASTNQSGLNSYLKISDLNFVPIIQFPKIFEYIKIHENRELIQFLFKYLLIYDNFQKEGKHTAVSGDSHFMTICVLLYSNTSSGKIDFQFLKQFHETLQHLENNDEKSAKFTSKLDPINKYPQILKLNEYELKSFFGKLDSKFKSDYKKMETQLNSIKNVETKTFFEHFVKISLLIKFIISQIVNVTIQLDCNKYFERKTNEAVEIPSLDELDTIKVLLSKILGLNDSYFFSNGKELNLSYNLNSNNKSTFQQVKCFKIDDNSVDDENDAVTGNTRNRLKNTAMLINAEGQAEFLDHPFMVNWILPLFSRFFRLPLSFPSFYTIKNLNFDNFNGVFKNEIYFTLLSVNNFKTIHNANPNIVSELKLTDCYVIGKNISLSDEKNINLTAFVNCEDETAIEHIDSADLKKWRKYLLEEANHLQAQHSTINSELEVKMEKLDAFRFDKIPNLINGKFDNLLMDSGDFIDLENFSDSVVTSTENKELNTKSKYYKFFQDETSVTNDLNVKTLKLRLEKAKDQVKLLENRLEDTKTEKENTFANTEITAVDYNNTVKIANEECERLDAALLKLQEEYKKCSDEAVSKVTMLTQLKEILNKKEKYLKVLESSASLRKESVLIGEKKLENVEISNYESLMTILKSKQQQLLNNDK